MAKYKVIMSLQTNMFSRHRRLHGYIVLKKEHWWSPWNSVFSTPYPQQAIDYINAEDDK